MQHKEMFDYWNYINLFNTSLTQGNGVKYIIFIQLYCLQNNVFHLVSLLALLTLFTASYK